MSERISINEELHRETLRYVTRRQFFKQCYTGMGALALASLLGSNPANATSNITAENPLLPKPPHFPPRAKRIIYLNMVGAPSQLDLWDYKPKLAELIGQPVPESYMEGLRFPFISGQPALMPSLHPFSQAGKSGTWISSQLPQTAKIVDDLTVVRTLFTEEVNHVPAQLFLNTGSPRMGRPCIGSWLTYGLGSESEDLPGFVVMTSGNPTRCGTACMSNGFLPSEFQGVQFRSEGEQVLYLKNPDGLPAEVRRNMLDTVHVMNGQSLSRVGDPEIATRIAAYEMAYKMQTSVPELMRIEDEPAHIHELYGTEPGKTSFANNCLMARRMIERGVRFVQLYHGGWDHHGGGDQNLVTNLPVRCRETDRGAAALVMDLKQRGLLDDTLVIWGGEFGRTPMVQGDINNKTDLGRDHLPSAFTYWLAGGGFKQGFNYGETDELGMHPIKEAVHVHDFQATVLHSMGINHERMTYRFQGRDFRLTDVHGQVVHDLFA